LPSYHLPHAFEIGGEIRIGDGERQRDRVAYAAAEQVGDRKSRRLADDVEQRHFDRDLGFGMSDQRAIELGHQCANAAHRLAEHDWPQIDVERGERRFRRSREHFPRCRLAPADHAVARRELEQHALHRTLDVADALEARHLDRALDQEQPETFDGGFGHVRPPLTCQTWPVT
jgi:hypothetical protein